MSCLQEMKIGKIEAALADTSRRLPESYYGWVDELRNTRAGTWLQQAVEYRNRKILHDGCIEVREIREVMLQSWEVADRAVADGRHWHTPSGLGGRTE
jgi:hypothetical protein